MINLSRITASRFNSIFSNGWSPGNGYLSNQEDCTLLATVRYLQLKRCGGDLTAIEPFQIISRAVSSAAWNALNTPEKDLSENYFPSNSLTINTTINGAFPQDAAYCNGWTLLNSAPYPVSPFLSKISETRVYIDPSKKRATIFVKRCNARWEQALCSILFRVLPWFFNEELSAQDKEFFKKINESNAEAVSNEINAELNKYDMEKYITEKFFDGFGGDWHVRMIDKAKSRLGQLQDILRDYERTLRTKEAEYATQLLELTALESIDVSETCNIKDCLDRNPEFQIEELRDEYDRKTVIYSVKTTLEYFDSDEFERIVNQPRSYFTHATPRVQRVLKSLFLDLKGKLRVMSRFSFDSEFRLEPMHIGWQITSRESCFPHPHLAFYGCLGDNRQAIGNYIRRCEWDMAIEQTAAATKNLNFGDQTVMDTLIREMEVIFDTRKCIDYEDEIMTPAEYLKRITDEETQTNNEGETNG